MWDAIIGGGLSALGSIGGGLFGGSNSGAKRLARAIQDATNFQKQVYGESTARLAPWVESGQGALPYMQQIAYNLEDSPLYSWRMGEFTDEMNKQLRARGLFNSGAGLAALTKGYNQIGAEEGDKKWDRLAYLSTSGLNAGSMTGNLGQSAANNMSGLAGQLSNVYRMEANNKRDAIQGLFSGLSGAYAGYQQNQARNEYMNLLKGLLLKQL